MTSVRVALIDDDPLVRTGLALILGGDARIEVVGEASDGADALRLVQTCRPDVILMDVRMEEVDGLRASEQLLAADPASKIIVLTTFDADETVLAAIRLGAKGFLLKDTPPAELVAAVHAVVAGQAILSPAVTTHVLGAVGAGGAVHGSAEAVAILARLTEREREVAEKIAAGMSNPEIASTLYLSLPTVKTHVGRIFAKLEVDNRVQVANIVRDAQG